MPRDAGPEWKLVDIMDDTGPQVKWRCTFCKLKYAGGADRIRAHVAGRGNFGIAPCSSKEIPKEIIDQYRSKIEEKVEERRMKLIRAEADAKSSSKPIHQLVQATLGALQHKQQTSLVDR